MSLFFSRIPAVETNFSIQSTSTALDEDVVILAPDVWDALYFSDEPRRLVSVKSKRQRPAISPSNDINDLTCWAIRDTTVSEIVVPPAWLTRYPAIFHPFHLCLNASSKSVILSSAQNITLTEVILTAKDEGAYLAASTLGVAFENWFFESNVIIRDGEEVFVPSNIFPSCRTSLQPLPSSLGYSINLTSPYKQGIAQRGLTRFIVTSSNDQNEESREMDSLVRNENLEINESFLISAVLSSPERLSQAGNGVFTAKVLHSPIDAEEDHFTVYVCTSDLRPLGLLNGDWVLASSVDYPTSRVVRIGVLDENFGDAHTRLAVLSPALLHNLCPCGSRRITLRVSPYGARDPGVPVARSIELVTVASPFSTHHRYEPLLADVIREHFSSSKRLIKSGDIIPLRINIDLSLDPHHVLLPSNFTVGASSCSYVPVYVVVRNVDCESVNVQPFGQPSSDLQPGCFVDSDVTKVVQVGVEHIKVPDIYDYYALGHTRVALQATYGISHQISQLTNALSLDEGANMGVQSTVFITGSRATGKFSAAVRIARHLQIHCVEINCFDVLSDTAAKMEVALREQVGRAMSCSPCIIVLRHADAFGHAVTADGKGSTVLQTLQRYIHDAGKTQPHQCILLGIAERGKIPEGISFSNEIEIKAFSEEDRLSFLTEEVYDQHAPLSPDVSLAALAKQSAALVAIDLVNLVKNSQLGAVLNSGMQRLATLPVISTKQFDIALLKARATLSQSIGAPSIPTVLWDDVGGLSQVKKDILDTVQLPLDHPELFQAGLKKRSGVLLYGPPGTGKTLLAKAVATSCSLNFLSVKGPELLNMYIGESEGNVRRVFQRAKDANPCVIFFDELDSIAPKRGNQGDSGGVMDRIVSQLLAELDGMGAEGLDIFVIGATNRPDLLDPALLRPGRFDKMLYLGVCDTHEAQLDILKALTRKFDLHPNLELSSIAASCPFTYTGADFYALCADALLHALSGKVEDLEKERSELNALSTHPISSQFFISEIKSDAELQLVVRAEDFELALEELVPSISDSELSYYASVQKNWQAL